MSSPAGARPSEPKRVSSAKGSRGSKKPAQKHKNQFAFRNGLHTNGAGNGGAGGAAPPRAAGSAALAAAFDVPNAGLCAKCVEIIQWRKRMGQYKALTAPKKCVSCALKAVKFAYHVLCQPCADKQQVCAKCQLPEESPSIAPKTPAQVLLEKQQEESVRASMTERQRRSYLRKLEAGDEEGAERIVDKVRNGGGRRGDDDFDDFDDDFDDDDEGDGGGGGGDDDDDEDDDGE
ncbi:hypothetical protein DFJ73DRAFT_794171 [Zopfochytrium polystomum]|nr:hypothetical protein DFJ73DRAFT_794171 [Zopfochytrium polystomum]